MPIYEYRCEQGHQFEVMRRMSDGPVMSCQTCSAPVERVFHPIAVHFKGSGFYNTDYGTRKRSRELKEAEGKSKSESSSSSDSSNSSNSSNSSDSSSSSESSSSSNSSDSKPAAKPESSKASAKTD